MATFTVIKLTQLSPLHIGTGKENYDFSASDLQSDTLLSALAAIRAQMGKTEDLESFLSSFSLSSAFPFYEKRYFFPKMHGKIEVKIKGMSEPEYRKKIKSVHFVESELWQELALGKSLEIDESQLQGEFLLATGKRVSIYKSQVNERVSVPRVSGEESKPFFFDWKYFDKRAGLYCLTDATGNLLEEIKLLFTILGENGLGTDKNIGGGKFSIEIESLSIESPQNANAVQMLSLYIPVKDELEKLNLLRSNYSLLLRGGYMAGSQEEDFRHLRKRSIYMFGVGSVFLTTQSLQGKIVDLQPAWNDKRMHAVLRSGRPFYLPIKLERYE